MGEFQIQGRGLGSLHFSGFSNNISSHSQEETFSLSVLSILLARTKHIQQLEGIACSVPFLSWWEAAITFCVYVGNERDLILDLQIHLQVAPPQTASPNYLSDLGSRRYLSEHLPGEAWGGQVNWQSAHLELESSDCVHKLFPLLSCGYEAFCC